MIYCIPLIGDGMDTPRVCNNAIVNANTKNDEKTISSFQLLSFINLGASNNAIPVKPAINNIIIMLLPPYLYESLVSLRL